MKNWQTLSETGQWVEYHNYKIMLLPGQCPPRRKMDKAAVARRQRIIHASRKKLLFNLSIETKI